MESVGTIIAVEWDGEVNIKRLEGIVGVFLETEGIQRGAIVDVLLTSDTVVAELNERYRGEKGPTDVLAFEIGRPERCETDVWAIGQVVISCDRAADQSGRVGVGLDDELAELLVHGLLHLVGYTHDDKESALAMEDRSKLILSKVSDV